MSFIHRIFFFFHLRFVRLFVHLVALTHILEFKSYCFLVICRQLDVKLTQLSIFIKSFLIINHRRILHLHSQNIFYSQGQNLILLQKCLATGFSILIKICHLYAISYLSQIYLHALQSEKANAICAKRLEDDKLDKVIFIVSIPIPGKALISLLRYDLTNRPSRRKYAKINDGNDQQTIYRLILLQLNQFNLIDELYIEKLFINIETAIKIFYFSKTRSNQNDTQDSVISSKCLISIAFIVFINLILLLAEKIRENMRNQRYTSQLIKLNHCFEIYIAANNIGKAQKQHSQSHQNLITPKLYQIIYQTQQILLLSSTCKASFTSADINSPLMLQKENKRYTKYNLIDRACHTSLYHRLPSRQQSSLSILIIRMKFPLAISLLPTQSIHLPLPVRDITISANSRLRLAALITRMSKTPNPRRSPQEERTKDLSPQEISLATSKMFTPHGQAQSDYFWHTTTRTTNSRQLQFMISMTLRWKVWLGKHTLILPTLPHRVWSTTNPTRVHIPTPSSPKSTTISNSSGTSHDIIKFIITNIIKKIIREMSASNYIRYFNDRCKVNKKVNELCFKYLLLMITSYIQIQNAVQSLSQILPFSFLKTLAPLDTNKQIINLKGLQKLLVEVVYTLLYLHLNYSSCYLSKKMMVTDHFPQEQQLALIIAFDTDRSKEQLAQKLFNKHFQLVQLEEESRTVDSIVHFIEMWLANYEQCRIKGFIQLSFINKAILDAQIGQFIYVYQNVIKPQVTKFKNVQGFISGLQYTRLFRENSFALKYVNNSLICKINKQNEFKEQLRKEILQFEKQRLACLQHKKFEATDTIFQKIFKSMVSNKLIEVTISVEKDNQQQKSKIASNETVKLSKVIESGQISSGSLNISICVLQNKYQFLTPDRFASILSDPNYEMCNEMNNDTYRRIHEFSVTYWSQSNELLLRLTTNYAVRPHQVDTITNILNNINLHSITFTLENSKKGKSNERYIILTTQMQLHQKQSPFLNIFLCIDKLIIGCLLVQHDICLRNDVNSRRKQVIDLTYKNLIAKMQNQWSCLAK